MVQALLICTGHLVSLGQWNLGCCVGEDRNAFRILVGTFWEASLGRLKKRWEDNIKGLWGPEMDGASSGSCLMVGFHNSDAEPSGFVTLFIGLFMKFQC